MDEIENNDIQKNDKKKIYGDNARSILKM